MHFKNFYLRSFRLFLFPLAIIYGAVIKTRNLLYNKNIIKSVEFNLPIICVGNISVGGTGKSPMVDYLVKLLKQQYEIATLSRGYKRRTSGYLLANEKSTDIEIGDEPMQFHLGHPEIAVAVGEKRIEAIPQLLYDRPQTKLIILDDAFQHREIFAGLNIVLTDHANLYTRDFFLPTGDLRDERASMKRAQVIVVTKCPLNLTEHDRFKLIKELSPEPEQQLFFTGIHYGKPYHLVSGEKIELNKEMEVMLICGIANPLPLTQYIHEHTKTYDAMFFSDHHLFSIDDLTAVKNRFDFLSEKNKIILTTEKDAVRLIKFKELLMDTPIYVIPISLEFLFDQRNEFDQAVLEYVVDFYAKEQNTN
jgi:tetraacyldisaccharide 4'-kinase